MDVLSSRTWVFFYLICFVATLWAVFLLTRGAMLFVSLLLVIMVIGFNCILLLAEVHWHLKRKESVSSLLSEKKP
jgi:O-antigen ligase